MICSADFVPETMLNRISTDLKTSLTNKIQKYPDEIEVLFSVFQGTNPEKSQDILEVSEYPDETQEHLEVCEGTQNERRGLQNLSNWRDLLKFWRRTSIRLSRMSNKTTRTSKEKT